MTASASSPYSIPGCSTPEQAAAFMAAAAAKVQGSPGAALGHAELVQHLASNRGRIPAADTPEAVAEFVMSVRTRPRSVAAAAPVPAPAAGPDMETPEGVAAFVLNAGAANADRRTGRLK